VNKREAAKLRKQRLAQIDRAVEARYSADMSAREEAALFRERDRQLRLAQEEYERNLASRPSRATSREKSTSRFWRHFGQDGRPVPPWETEAGPHMDDDSGYDDDNLFAEGGYGYEDFDIDWGGYDYEDTGYDDENA
jgi:hypothetical protein